MQSDCKMYILVSIHRDKGRDRLTALYRPIKQTKQSSTNSGFLWNFIPTSYHWIIPVSTFHFRKHSRHWGVITYFTQSRTMLYHKYRRVSALTVVILTTAALLTCSFRIHYCPKASDIVKFNFELIHLKTTKDQQSFL